MSTAFALAAIWAATLVVARFAGRSWGIVRIAGVQEWPARLLPPWLSRHVLLALTSLEIAGIVAATILAGTKGWYAVALLSLAAYFPLAHHLIRLEMRQWLRDYAEYAQQPGAEPYR